MTDALKLKKPRRLTLKQRRFISEYIANGGNGTKAAIVAYGASPNVARSMASENMAKPAVHVEIEAAFLRKQIDPDWAAIRIQRAGDAQKRVVAIDGSVTEVGHDYEIQLKAVDRWAKIIGAEHKEPTQSLTAHVHLLGQLRDLNPSALRRVAAGKSAESSGSTGSGAMPSEHPIIDAETTQGEPKPEES